MYALYFPDEGRYSEIMPWPKAKALSKHFPFTIIVDARTGIEV